MKKKINGKLRGQLIPPNKVITDKKKRDSKRKCRIKVRGE